MIKKRLAAVFCAAVMGVCLTGNAFATTGDTETKEKELPTSVKAKAAVVMEAGTGHLLFAQNENEHLPMASTTKIMTALITLEAQDIDAYFTVDPDAIRVEGSSLGLKEGDQISLRGLAQGMLSVSGNDAANAAAVKIAGSTEAFVELMNRRAAEMGLTDTHFETPSGLDGEGHYTTAKELAIIGATALQNPDFAEICGQSRIKINFGNPPFVKSYQNHNRLLREYEGAIGVKTGFTKKAGRCLVSAARRDGVTLICVTLAAEDDWNLHKTLLDAAFSGIHPTKLPVEKKEVPVVGGKEASVPVEPFRTPYAALFSGDGEKVEVSYELPSFLYAPVQKGRVVGTVTYRLEGKVIETVELIATKGVEPQDIVVKKSIWQKIGEFFKNLFS